MPHIVSQHFGFGAMAAASRSSQPKMRPSCTPAPTPTPITQPNNSNVLFVSRIAGDCTEEQLRGSVLSSFGPIVSVRLCNQDKSRGNSAYAFVAYQNAAEANAAVEAKPNGGSLFCGNIKIADPPRSKVKFDALEERNAQRWDEVTRMIAEKKPNVVLHVNASHCDRMVDYLSISRKDRPGINYEHADKVSFVSVLPCDGSTNLKLILLTFRGDPEVLVRDISEKAFLTTALNRCFIVEQGISIETTGVDEVSQKAIELLKKKCADRDTNKSANEEQRAAIRLRVQSYPSKLQQTIADGIEQSNAALRSAVILDPVNYNTILSVVRVHTDEAPPSKSRRSTVGRTLTLTLTGCTCSGYQMRLHFLATSMHGQERGDTKEASLKTTRKKMKGQKQNRLKYAEPITS